MAASNEQSKIVATLNINGKNVPMNAEAFGNYVCSNYRNLNFMWTEQFAHYRDHHVMAEVLGRLKDGLDEVSCEYIDLHERLVELARSDSAILVKESYAWTNVDRALLDNYRQKKEADNPPFLRQVAQDWGSSFTNLYGLYDLPAGMLASLNGRDIIDAGGFVGDTLLLFKALFGNSKLHSFEPGDLSYKQLSNMLADDIKAGNILAHKKGLGEKPGTIRLSRTRSIPDATASMAIDYHKGDDFYEDVGVITLDDYVREHNLDVGLIKVDVEGFEPEVIRGALETIKKSHPVLVLAFYHTPEEFYELKSYIESLNLGYRFQVRRSSICLPLTDLVLIAY